MGKNGIKAELSQEGVMGQGLSNVIKPSAPEF